MGSSDPSSFDQTIFMKNSWVVEIRSFINEVTEEDESIPVCIFSVPKSLAAIHPEAYSPQLISVGPYHHRQDDLLEMDRHKLMVVKRVVQNKCKDLSFERIVKEILKLEPRIRACYHNHLEIDGETLAWLMAIDGLFLLEFLQNYGEKDPSVLAGSSKMSYLVDTRGRKIGYDSILKDMLMLGNQIPLFVLSKIFKIQCESSLGGSEYDDKDLLSTMLLGVCKELSPLKLKDGLSPTQVLQHLHLLDLLYHLMVPQVDEEEPKQLGSSLNDSDVDQKKHKKADNNDDDDDDEDHEEEGNTSPDDEEEDGDSKKKHKKSSKSKGSISAKDIFGNLWSLLMKCNVQLLKGIQLILFSKPMKVILKLPWKILSKLPIVSMIAPAIEGCFSNLDPNQESSSIGNIPLVDEIMIPSVTSLYGAGVNFFPIEGDITTIKFDLQTLKFHLPIVELDVNSEVIMRNLVAYEAVAVSGPLVLARYTEFMNGIIDIAEDARALRKKKIIYNHLKSDKEVANLWNGMSRSVRLTKVGFLDKAIDEVKGYYESTWKVKGYKLMKRSVYGSWEVILVFGALLLLCLMGLQAFCSVYSCPRLFNITTSTSDD